MSNPLGRVLDGVVVSRRRGRVQFSGVSPGRGLASLRGLWPAGLPAALLRLLGVRPGRPILLAAVPRGGPVLVAARGGAAVSAEPDLRFLGRLVSPWGVSDSGVSATRCAEGHRPRRAGFEVSTEVPIAAGRWHPDTATRMSEFQCAAGGAQALTRRMCRDSGWQIYCCK
jgi:hypothetical protein